MYCLSCNHRIKESDATVDDEGIYHYRCYYPKELQEQVVLLEQQEVRSDYGFPINIT
jgi:hypothetical protein